MKSLCQNTQLEITDHKTVYLPAAN